MNKGVLLAIILVLGVVVMMCRNFSAIRSGDVGYFSGVGLGVVNVIKGEADVLENAYTPLAALYFYIVYRSFPSTLFAETWAVYILFWLVVASIYGWRRLGSIDKWLFTASILVTSFLLHSTVVFGRYDILVGTLLFFTWRSFRFARYGESAFFVVLAAGMKFVPAVFWPLLLICVPKKKRKRLLFGTAVGLVVVLVVPALFMGKEVVWQNLEYAVSFHEGRGIQVESMWSGVNMLWNKAWGSKSVIWFHHYAHHNENLGKFIEDMSRFLLLASMSFMYALAWVRGRKEKSFTSYFFALILLVLGVSPILSTSFFVWIIPLVVGWVIENVVESKEVSLETVLVMFVVVTMGLITQWIYPYNYEPELLSQNNIWLTVLLNVRNGLIFVLAGLFLWQLRGRKKFLFKS